jgi:hypothetical protein
MAKKLTKNEPDSVYFLKIVLFFVLGTIWIKVNGRPLIPAGLVLGLVFSSHEHFMIDRKIEYAVLLVAALLGFLGLGIFISIGL